MHLHVDPHPEQKIWINFLLAFNNKNFLLTENKSYIVEYWLEVVAIGAKSQIFLSVAQATKLVISYN